MTKEVKQLIITGVLILILIGVILANLKKKPKPASKPDTSKAQSASPAAVPIVYARPPTTADENIKNLQNLRAGLPWGRDPFVEASKREGQIDTLKLQGISFGQDKSGYAFINNEIVKKGDRIGDYEVVEIEKTRVLLKKDNQSFYLAFPNEE